MSGNRYVIIPTIYDCQSIRDLNLGNYIYTKTHVMFLILSSQDEVIDLKSSSLQSLQPNGPEYSNANLRAK